MLIIMKSIMTSDGPKLVKLEEVTRDMILKNLLSYTENFPFSINDTQSTNLLSDVEKNIKNRKDLISEAGGFIDVSIAEDVEELKYYKQKQAETSKDLKDLDNWWDKIFKASKITQLKSLLEHYKSKISNLEERISNSDYELGIYKYSRLRGISNSNIDKDIDLNKALAVKDIVIDVDDLASNLIEKLTLNEKLINKVLTLSYFELISIMLLISEGTFSITELETYLSLDGFIPRKDFLLNSLLEEYVEMFKPLFINDEFELDVNLKSNIDNSLLNLKSLRISNDMRQISDISVSGSKSVSGNNSVFKLVQADEDSGEIIFNVNVSQGDTISEDEDLKISIGKLIFNLSQDIRYSVNIEYLLNNMPSSEYTEFSIRDIIQEILNLEYLNYIDNINTGIFDIESLSNSIKTAVYNKFNSIQEESAVTKLIRRIYGVGESDTSITTSYIDTGEFLTHISPQIESLLRKVYKIIFPDLGDIKPSDPKYLITYLINTSDESSYINNMSEFLNLKDVLSFDVSLDNGRISNINMSVDSRKILDVINATFSSFLENIDTNQSFNAILSELRSTLNDELIETDLNGRFDLEFRYPVLLEMIKDFINTADAPFNLNDYDELTSTDQLWSSEGRPALYYKTSEYKAIPVKMNTDNITWEADTYYKKQLIRLVSYRAVTGDEHVYRDSEIQLYPNSIPNTNQTILSIPEDDWIEETSRTWYIYDSYIDNPANNIKIDEMIESIPSPEEYSAHNSYVKEYGLVKILTEDEFNSEKEKNSDIYKLNDDTEDIMINIRTPEDNEYILYHEGELKSDGYYYDSIINSEKYLKSKDYYSVYIRDSAVVEVSRDIVSPGKDISVHKNNLFYTKPSNPPGVYDNFNLISDITIDNLCRLLSIYYGGSSSDYQLYQRIKKYEIMSDDEKESLTYGDIIYTMNVDGLIMPYSISDLKIKKSVGPSGLIHRIPPVEISYPDPTGTVNTMVESNINTITLNYIKNNPLVILKEVYEYVPIYTYSTHPADPEVTPNLYVKKPKEYRNPMSTKSPISDKIRHYVELLNSFRDIIFNINNFIYKINENVNYKQLEIAMDIGV